MGHVPIRTCVACGAKQPKPDLIRLGLIPPATIGESPFGRGAYVCRNQACVGRLNLKKLAWAIRLSPVPVDLTLASPTLSAGEPTN